MSEGLVRFEDVSRRFGDVAAVDRVSLEIGRGEFFALLGPSGCGKTTLMRLLAGFETPDAGRILLDGEDLAEAPPHRRPVNMMFQSYALFPHLSVEKNVGFGLKMDGLPKQRIADRVAEMLALVRLEGLARRMPHQLSGGQKQRVALARSLAKRPKVLLLDEPLAALDKSLREETQFELKRLQRSAGAAFVIVTHDQDEAMALADRMAVMDSGRIIQAGAPAELYDAPASRRVAGFIGEVNLAPASAAGPGLWRTAWREAPFEARAAADGAWLAVRPERLSLTSGDAQLTNGFAATVAEVGYFGDRSVYLVRTPGGAELRASDAARPGAPAFRPGDAVTVSFAPGAAMVLAE